MPLKKKDIERTDGCPMSFYVQLWDSVAAFDSTGILASTSMLLPKKLAIRVTSCPVFLNALRADTLLRRAGERGPVGSIGSKEFVWRIKQKCLRVYIG